MYVVTQDAVATRFADLSGDKLRYCHSTGAWFEWDGIVWRKNETMLAFHWARILARELSAGEDEKGKKEVQKASFARAVETFCRADTIFAVTIDYWDRDLFKLGTPAHLNKLARQLNERPRETLQFETPAERFNACVASTG
jgi:putative DNA primase/helicase